MPQAPSIVGSAPNLPIISTVPTSDINALSALRETLPTGSFLQVRVALDSKGQPAVVIQGQEFSANLPKDLKVGQELLVKVLANTDQLYLQILQPQTAAGNAASSTDLKFLAQNAESMLLKDFVEQFLSKPALESLLTSATEMNQEIDLKQALPAQKEKVDEQVESPQLKTASPLTQRFEQAIEKLLQQNVLVKPEPQIDASTFAKQLIKTIIPNIQKGLGEAQTSLLEISKQQPSPQEVRLLTALQTNLEKILSSQKELSFEPAVPAKSPQVGAEQLKLYIEASLLLMQNGSQQSLNKLSEELRVNDNHNPLLFLIKTLTSLSPDGTPSSGNNQQFAALLKSIVSDLKLLRDERAPDKDIRATLKKVLDNVTKQLGPKLSEQESSKLENTKLLFKTLEHSLSTRETLAKLNPFMQSMGQPSLNIIPALVDGHFSQWKMVTFGRKVDPESSKSGSKKGSSEPWQQVQLFINLPGLGEIAINLAHKDKELLLNLTLNQADKSEFVASKFPDLQKSCQALGYSEPLLKAQTGQTATSLPGWYEEIVERFIIA